MSTETQKVDVLAVMAYAVETFRKLNREAACSEDHVLDIEDAENARAAVAELIGAAREVEVDAASLGMTAKRLSAALARVGGAA